MNFRGILCLQSVKVFEYHAALAQLAERPICNRKVTGSIPVGGSDGVCGNPAAGEVLAFSVLVQIQAPQLHVVGGPR